MLLIKTIQGFQRVKDFMSGHSRTSQALKQVYLLYGKSWFVCVVRHGFQQAENKVKHKSKYFSSTVLRGTWLSTLLTEKPNSGPTLSHASPIMLSTWQQDLFLQSFQTTFLFPTSFPSTFSTKPPVTTHLLSINLLQRGSGWSVIKAATRFHTKLCLLPTIQTEISRSQTDQLGPRPEVKFLWRNFNWL